MADKKMILDSKKVRVFRVELYPVTESYDFKTVHGIIDKNYDWIRILHDKDVKADGTPCDNHYHYVVRSDQFTIRRTSLASQLGIDAVWILPCFGKDSNSLDDALLYLTHANKPEKYQYMLSAVESKTNSKLFERWWVLLNVEQDNLDELAMANISYWIYSQKQFITMQDLMEFILQNGYLKFYRKDRQTYHRMVDEKNMRYGYDGADFLARRIEKLPLTISNLNDNN